MIKMVDFKLEYEHIRKEISAAINDVLDSGIYIGGEHVKRLESTLSSEFCVRYVNTCASGTDALQISLMALGIHDGEVIVPSFCFVSPAEVVKLLGLHPIFVDVNESFNIDPSSIDESVTHKTKAVIVSHMFGGPADIESIVRVCDKHGLKIIEDNAQSLGSKFNCGIYAGCVGDVGCTSFFPTKNLGAYGDGGAIFTNNQEISEKVRKIALHGQSHKYRYDLVGVNSRLDSIQAAILNVKLKYFKVNIEKKIAIASKYNAAFENALKIPTSENGTHTYNQYTIILGDKSQRDNLMEKLSANFIESVIYYPSPISNQLPYLQKASKLPMTEFLVDRVLSLPIHAGLSDEEVRFVIEKVLENI